MQPRWDDPGAMTPGQSIRITGYPVGMPGQSHAARFLLSPEPPCCPGCAPSASLIVESRSALPMLGGALVVEGIWQPPNRLTGARLAEPAGWGAITRRRALGAGPLVCLGVARAGVARAGVASAPVPRIDLHSHAGGIAGRAWVRGERAAFPVAVPMRQGEMAAVCFAVVSDGPTHKILFDGRIHPFRDPNPGELYAWGTTAFGRLHAMLLAQGLPIVRRAADLQPGRASAIVAAEGADFLEGRIERIEEAYRQWSLRHLQLVHYRVNELGDIQTEPAVHGGLTDTGAEAIRACNRLGVVVDVAHATYDLVKRAASVATKPLVLSHTSLTSRPGAFTRLVTAEHARVVAETGGVVGVWPPKGLFPTMDALAAGIARMAGAIGIDHVGLGSDMNGLVGPSIFPNYDSMPALAEALSRAGFDGDDIGKLLGGNYLRVFGACVG